MLTVCEGTQIYITYLYGMFDVGLIIFLVGDSSWPPQSLAIYHVHCSNDDGIRGIYR